MSMTQWIFEIDAMILSNYPVWVWGEDWKVGAFATMYWNPASNISFPVDMK